MLKQSKIKIIAADVLYYIAGGLIYSAAVRIFLYGSQISPGGVTGIATMLDYLFSIPAGAAVFVINIPILLLGFFKFGGVFIVKTSIGTAVVSLCLDIADKLFPPADIEPILSAVFGGLMMGFGLSLFMLRGATTGGVDIIAKTVNHRFAHFTVGRIILFSDAAVVTLNALVYRNLESALYSVIALYTSSKIMDVMLYGGDKGKIIYIITDRAGDMAREIMTLVKRGVTVLDVKGAYTGRKREMLMCTVRRHEISSLYRIVKQYDKNAFTIVADAGEIFGEGFKII